ncbi:MAG: hypothetical protein ACJATI_003436 [Halioglobus sp.]|jgi:hypothetical protein
MKQLSVQYDGMLGARLPSAAPLLPAENAFRKSQKTNLFASLTKRVIFFS